MTLFIFPSGGPRSFETGQRLMNSFQTMPFEPTQCRAQLDRCNALLASKSELSESDNVRPLFESCRQLAAFIGITLPGIGPATRLAFDFDVFGHGTADLVIGNHETQTYCAIKFEDAHEDSVFRKTADGTQREWCARLEHGFGQLIDWFCAFDGHRKSIAFTKHFGHGHLVFHGMLLIGRSAHLTESNRARLRWRSERVTINTHRVCCQTYDELFGSLNWQGRFLTGGSDTSGSSE